MKHRYFAEGAFLLHSILLRDHRN